MAHSQKLGYVKVVKIRLTLNQYEHLTCAGTPRFKFQQKKSKSYLIRRLIDQKLEDHYEEEG